MNYFKNKNIKYNNNLKNIQKGIIKIIYIKYMTTIISNIKHHFNSLNIVEKLLAFFSLFALMGSLWSIYFILLLKSFFDNILDVLFKFSK